MIAYIAVFISFVSLCISALTFYRGSLKAQNEKVKKELMRSISLQALVVWDQMSAINSAQVSNYELNEYFFPSYKKNVLRLEELINQGVSIGLYNVIVGEREHALSLHSAFIQSLVQMETQNSDYTELSKWIPQHFAMGMVRLLNGCITFDPLLIPETESEVVEKVFSLKEIAWTYVLMEKGEAKLAQQSAAKSA